jgi:hypothetical protein
MRSIIRAVEFVSPAIAHPAWRETSVPVALSNRCSLTLIEKQH